MKDAHSDAAVENYAKANNNRVVILNKSGVFIARNDRGRQNPIRNPKKNSHDDGLPRSNQRFNNSQHLSAPQYENSYFQDSRRPPPMVPHGHDDGSNHVNYAPASYPYPDLYHNQHHVPLPAAAPPPEQYSYANTNSHVFFNASVHNAPPPQPNFQSFQPSRMVLLENLPLSATPDDISACLYQYSLNVLSCTIEYDNDPKAGWCYAHIALSNSEESNRCVALAQQSLLEYRGRILTASMEANNFHPQGSLAHTAPPIVSHPPPASRDNIHFYQQGPQASDFARSTPPRVGPGATNNNFRRGAFRGRGRHRQNRRDRPY